jgi:hypothetical protein
LVLQFPAPETTPKETDFDRMGKRPQVGASGMVYVKCNEDGTTNHPWINSTIKMT